MSQASQTPSSSPKTIYCTIAAANYLHRVEVLRDSLAKQGHTDFRVVLVEHPAAVARLRSQLPGLHILGPDEIGCPEWVHMAFYYDVMEFATALKPALMRHLLPEGNVVYLDPDIEVFSPLTEIEAQLAESDIIVTPHVSQPLPLDGCQPTMAEVIQRGQFNLGFLAVRSAPENKVLLDWWHSVLVEGAAADDQRGTFTDQFWAAALVSFARKSHILRSARYNLAYWNILHHQLTWDGTGVPQTEDGPLGFYHYSGLERKNLSKVSKHQSRIHIEPTDPLYLLLTQYLNRIDRAPLARFASYRYSFDRYVDGSPIQLSERRAFLLLPAANRRLLLNPFAEFRYIRGLAAASPLIQAGSQAQNLAAAHHQIERLMRQLNTLPHSVFSHMRSAANQVAPGVWDRVYNRMERTSRVLRPKLATFRHLLG